MALSLHRATQGHGAVASELRTATFPSKAVRYGSRHEEVRPADRWTRPLHVCGTRNGMKDSNPRFSVREAPELLGRELEQTRLSDRRVPNAHSDRRRVQRFFSGGIVAADRGTAIRRSPLYRDWASRSSPSVRNPRRTTLSSGGRTGSSLLLGRRHWLSQCFHQSVRPAEN